MPFIEVGVNGGLRGEGEEKGVTLEWNGRGGGRGEMGGKRVRMALASLRLTAAPRCIERSPHPNS